MKSKLTVLIESLEKATNLITPNDAGSTPIANTPAAFADLGYRIGRALSMARQLKSDVAYYRVERASMAREKRDAA